MIPNAINGLLEFLLLFQGYWVIEERRVKRLLDKFSKKPHQSANGSSFVPGAKEPQNVSDKPWWIGWGSIFLLAVNGRKSLNFGVGGMNGTSWVFFFSVASE